MLLVQALTIWPTQAPKDSQPHCPWSVFMDQNVCRCVSEVTALRPLYSVFQASSTELLKSLWKQSTAPHAFLFLGTGGNQPTWQTAGTLLILLWRGAPGRARPWLCTLLRPFDLPECTAVLPLLKSLSSWGWDSHLQDKRTNPRVQAGDCRCDLLHHPAPPASCWLLELFLLSVEWESFLLRGRRFIG